MIRKTTASIVLLLLQLFVLSNDASARGDSARQPVEETILNGQGFVLRVLCQRAFTTYDRMPLDISIHKTSEKQDNFSMPGASDVAFELEVRERGGSQRKWHKQFKIEELGTRCE